MKASAAIYFGRSGSRIRLIGGLSLRRNFSDRQGWITNTTPWFDAPPPEGVAQRLKLERLDRELVPLCPTLPFQLTPSRASLRTRRLSTMAAHPSQVRELGWRRCGFKASQATLVSPKNGRKALLLPAARRGDSREHVTAQH